MLYYLFDWLDGVFRIPGIGVFQYITFRAAMAVICSLLITIVFGKRLIQYLRRKQVGESIRNLGLEGQMQKQGTPTMGGVIIIAAILIPTFLFAKLNNIYVILMIVTTIWLGTLGFIDDYIKVFKKDKKGLAGKFKILGQVLLGIIVGLTILYHPDITVRKKVVEKKLVVQSVESIPEGEKVFFQPPVKSIKTTIPFVKNNEFDYAKLISWMGSYSNYWVWLIYVMVVIFIITAVSNAANLTDGIDGLATGTSAIVGASLAVLAWLSGNIVFANYLNIMYLPNIGELTVFIAAFIGATIGFLWYNTYPAQVFMGDTGSLALGGIIAVFAILIRKELLIPIMCGVFLVENFSVVLQVSYFKYTKKRFGEGKRIFLMSPLHHHFQKKGYAEPKIVQRFFIVGIILAVVSIITLKLR